ncbi:glycoside hydrolase 5 family protein [Flammeovirga agarivorans]|uniref:Cellulase family glycosylhydrolase n=1 Tax=Flammeovirga agarivorans TaxID=2726742 RepID=A0A7X8XY79_9BACT|nr:cellulase family glycosylhydrolase [Flammeovirga agarivorans]NLR93961.1 cellulase family glycosylhydrolase [Flammeovirga agarivorans]
MKLLVTLYIISTYFASVLFAQGNSFTFVKNGELFNADGSKAAYFGVNFQSCLSWEYKERLKSSGKKFSNELLKYNSDEGIKELITLGVQAIRLHLTPNDFTNEEGHLVDNIYSQNLDYTLSLAKKNNIKVYITLVNVMTKGYDQSSFLNKYLKNKELILTEEESLDKIEVYIKELLNHVNPYTKVAYKDESNILFFEILNEPHYPNFKHIENNGTYLKGYNVWLTENQKVSTLQNYDAYTAEYTTEFINRMYKVIRSTGAKHPVVWNCNWNKFFNGRNALKRAIAKSSVEGVAFCLYPGQANTKKPYWKHPENLENIDFTEYLEKVETKNSYLAWVNEKQFQEKFVACYEFETFFNQSAYLYPAMADVFTNLRVQVATQWTYGLPIYAEYYNGSHFFNLKTTPVKAVSFMTASKIFNHNILQNNKAEYGYSFKNDDCFYSDDHFFISLGKHEKNIDINLQYPFTVIGYEDNGLVKYDGKGMYSLFVDKNSISIDIQPDSKWKYTHWDNISNPKGEINTQLSYNKKHKIDVGLLIPEGKKVNVYRIEKGHKTLILKNKLVTDIGVNAGKYCVEWDQGKSK